MSSNIQLYQQKGLTEDEAKLVERWQELGRPGIGRIKADFLSSIYNLGYTCQDINKMFPEYELPALLWSRINFEWDKRREEYRANLIGTIGQQAMDARLESIRFLTEVVRASHVKWREQIMRYLAAPDREKAPAFLADDVREYKEVMMLLKELTTPDKEKNPATKPGDNPNAQGLPTININMSGGNVQVTSDRAQEVKDALMKDVTNTVKKNE